MIALFAVCVLTFAAANAANAFESVRVQVIDRGQADGILIRTPSSKWIVIDAGTNGEQSESIREPRVVPAVGSETRSYRISSELVSSTGARRETACSR